MSLMASVKPKEWQGTRRNPRGLPLIGAGAAILAFVSGIFIPVFYLILYTSIRQGWFMLFAGGAVQTLFWILLSISPLILTSMGFVVLLGLSGDFFQKLYSAPADINPRRLILQRLSGLRRLRRLPPLPSTFWKFPGGILRREKLADINMRVILLGGPVPFAVRDGYGLYLERGSHFSRVVGPGKDKTFIGLYETIDAIVDCRPRVKIDKVDAWTKDGIKTTTYIRLEGRVGAPPEVQVDESLVYPFDAQAIRKVVEYTVVERERAEGDLVEADWLSLAWQHAQGVLVDYIASHRLDEIFLATGGSGSITSSYLGEQLRKNLNEITSALGIYITSLQITKVEIPEQVKLQRVRTWEAPRLSLTKIIAAQAQADRIRAIEKARAEAKHDLIVAIASGLERMDADRLPETLLLSLSGFLEKGLGDPFVRIQLTKETVDTLENLQKQLK